MTRPDSGSLGKREQGAACEALALDYLRQQGLELKEQNYTCRVGEIDLIMRHRDQLVFVEVRFRKQQSFGGASATVDSRKQGKLIRSAHTYLQEQRLGNRISCRFDVVAISPGNGKFDINWIRNAFTENFR